MYCAIPEPKYSTCSLFLGLLEPEWWVGGGGWCQEVSWHESRPVMIKLVPYPLYLHCTKKYFTTSLGKIQQHSSFVSKVTSPPPPTTLRLRNAVAI